MDPQKKYEYRIIDLVKRQRYEEALEIVYEALLTYPTHPFFRKNEIFLLYKLGKIKEARDLAEARIESFKNDLFFLQIYLLILEKEKRKDDILQLIEQHILPSRIGNERFFTFLADLVERIFDRDKALEMLKKAQVLIQEDVKLEELIKRYEEEPDKASLKYYKKKFAGRPANEIIKEIEQIRYLPAYQQDEGLHLYLAELYKDTRRYDMAIEIYRYLLGIKDRDFLRKMIGYAYYKEGDMENALTYLKDLFLKNPHDHYLYSTIYSIFKKLDDYEGLERLVKDILATHPDATHLYGLLKRARRWKK